MVIKQGGNKIRPALYVEVDAEETVATNDRTETKVDGYLMVTTDEVLVWTGTKQPTIDTSRTLVYDPLPVVTPDGVMMIEE